MSPSLSTCLGTASEFSNFLDFVHLKSLGRKCSWHTNASFSVCVSPRDLFHFSYLTKYEKHNI